MLLADYIPPFVSQTREFTSLFNILQIEVDNIVRETEQRLKDMFVLGCSEYATSRYESIVGISPKLSNSLETRQLEIISKYNELAPFTYEKLEEMLTSLLGVDGFTMSLDISTFYLKVVISPHKVNFLPTVYSMLERIVPLNINIHYESISNMDSNLYVSSVVKTATTFSISDNRLTNNATPDLYIGNLVRTATKHSI